AKAWSSAIRTVCATVGLPVVQSLVERGSLACDPAYSGAPVHWLVSTLIIRCVASVGGIRNDRVVRSGATGLGTPAGNALAGLVNTCRKLAGFVHAVKHDRISNWRRAVNRFCAPGSGSCAIAGRSSALTWIRVTSCGRVP